MARQPYFVNTSEKQMEVFSSYGGGMVTQAHPEKLKDNQSILLENVDIIQSDVIQTRGAYALDSSCAVVNYGSMAELADEGFTFGSLSQFTFGDLLTSFAKSIIEPSLYFSTMSQLKAEGVTFNTLKKYTFDQLKNEGAVKPNSGDSQGMFRYYKDDATYTDILAINGKLYRIVDNVTYRKLVITGLSSFQTVRPIEAVQYRDKMYFATGSGLVVYDGTTASLVQAYKPNGLEALYIGTNGLADNPDQYMTDTTGASNTILGVIPSLRYGVVNQSITFTAYISQIAGNSLEFMFETKSVSDANYVVAQNWGVSKVFTTSFAKADDYMVRVNLRVAGTTLTLSQYILPKYSVKSAPDSKATEDGVNYLNLSTCNRIFVNYDRLYMYGDTTNHDSLYISHLNNFTYFPRTNIMKIIDPTRGKLQSVVRYKNFLLCWTDSSIQMITGTDPTTFAVQPVHTTLGTKFPYSIQIMNNYVAFVGNDNGVYLLKSFNYASDDKLNVERIDEDIRDVIGGLIKTSTNILSAIYNNQYFLYIENENGNYIYRMYYELGVWVRDSIDLSFMTLYTLGNSVMASDRNNGIVYKLRQDKFLDGVNKRYVAKIMSKQFNFNMPHHKKKLKQYQLITNLTATSTIKVEIFFDGKLITTTPVSYDPDQTSDTQKLKIMTSGRFRQIQTALTIPVKEHVQINGFGFVFKENTPK
jgi:hypothetical protein